MKRKSNQQRRDETTQAFERKVRVLNEIREGRRPRPDYLPGSMNQLRSWVNADLGLVRLGSPSATSRTESPHHETLITDAEDVLRSLKSMSAQRKLKAYVSVGAQVDKLEGEKAEMEERLKRIASEALSYRHQLTQALKALRDVRSDLETMTHDFNALRADHINATNSKPRRIK